MSRFPEFIRKSLHQKIDVLGFAIESCFFISIQPELSFIGCWSKPISVIKIVAQRVIYNSVWKCFVVVADLRHEKIELVKERRCFHVLIVLSLLGKHRSLMSH